MLGQDKREQDKREQDMLELDTLELNTLESCIRRQQPRQPK
jgi:hypothetical protein